LSHSFLFLFVFSFQIILSSYSERFPINRFIPWFLNWAQDLLRRYENLAPQGNSTSFRSNVYDNPLKDQDFRSCSTLSGVKRVSYSEEPDIRIESRIEGPIQTRIQNHTNSSDTEKNKRKRKQQVPVKQDEENIPFTETIGMNIVNEVRGNVCQPHLQPLSKVTEDHVSPFKQSLKLCRRSSVQDASIATADLKREFHQYNCASTGTYISMNNGAAAVREPPISPSYPQEAGESYRMPHLRLHDLKVQALKLPQRSFRPTMELAPPPASSPPSVSVLSLPQSQLETKKIDGYNISDQDDHSLSNKDNKTDTLSVSLKKENIV
jgi:hypothetical protein